jgi:hypothetical protein
VPRLATPEDVLRDGEVGPDDEAAGIELAFPRLIVALPAAISAAMDSAPVGRAYIPAISGLVL